MLSASFTNIPDFDEALYSPARPKIFNVGSAMAFGQRPIT